MYRDEYLDEELSPSDNNDFVVVKNFNVKEFLHKREGNFEILTKNQEKAFDLESDCVESSPDVSYKAVVGQMCHLFSGNPSIQLDVDSDASCRNDFTEYKTKMLDISKNLDGTLFKKILRNGTGDVVGSERLVKFHYNLFIEGQDEPFDSSRFRNRIKKVKLGAQMLIPGLDLALTSMKKGEVADFIISPDLAFLERGCSPRVPPNSEILAEIELLNWEPEAVNDEEAIDTMTIGQRERLSGDQILRFVEKKLNFGKIAFNKGKINAACNRYNEARVQLELSNVGLSVEEKFKLEKFRCRVYKNLALCYVSLDLIDKANRCMQILEKTYADDLKVLYLRAKLLFKEGKYSEALITARRVQNIAPSNSDVIRLVEQIIRAKVEYDKKLKEQARLMFLKPAKEERVSEKPIEENEMAVSQSFQNFITKTLQEFVNSDDCEFKFERYSYSMSELKYIEIAAAERNVTLVSCDVETEGCYMKLVK